MIHTIPGQFHSSSEDFVYAAVNSTRYRIMSLPVRMVRGSAIIHNL